MFVLRLFSAPNVLWEFYMFGVWTIYPSDLS
jgi:hypothetical protein